MKQNVIYKLFSSHFYVSSTYQNLYFFACLCTRSIYFIYLKAKVDAFFPLTLAIPKGKGKEKYSLKPTGIIYSAHYRKEAKCTGYKRKAGIMVFLVILQIFSMIYQ